MQLKLLIMADGFHIMIINIRFGGLTRNIKEQFILIHYVE